MQDVSLYPTPAPTLPSREFQGKHWSASRAPNLYEYWVILQKYWRTVLIVLLLCAAAALASIYKTEPVYTATAVLRIQSQTPDITGVSSAFVNEGGGSEESDYYRTQLNLLQSRSLAARVIKDLRLAEHPDFRGAGTFSSWLHESAARGARAALQRLPFRRHAPSTPPKETPSDRSNGNEFELGVHPDLVNLYLNMLQVGTVDRSQLVAIEAT